MYPSAVTVSLAPDRILSAFDSYRGTMLNLDCGEIVTADSLSAECDAIGRRMCAAGLTHGDRVIVAVSNGPLFISTFMAALATGGSPVLVHAKTPAAELQRTADRFGARFIATDSLGDVDTQWEESSAVTPWSDEWGRLVGCEVDSSRPAFETRFPSLPSVPLHPTSGTTGQPKVAVRPGCCAVAEAEHYIATLDVGANDVILAAPPMSHAYGYGMCLMVPLISGARIVTMREFKVSTACRAIESAGITILPAVPGMIDAMLFSGTSSFARAGCRVLSAGAPLSERSAMAFRAKTGIAVQPLYGTTETGGISIATDLGGTDLVIDDDSHRDADAMHPRLPREPGYVGVAMDGVSIRASAPPEDSETAFSTLHVRSASMMAGYLAPDGINDESICDGWFDTGDIASTTETHGIFLKGRRAEVINRGGLKVLPSEVEEVLHLLDEVADVKVYRRIDPTGLETVRAAIVADGALSVSEVRAHCDKHLVFYKRPSHIVFLDALPKTASGKVILNELP